MKNQQTTIWTIDLKIEVVLFFITVLLALVTISLMALK